MSSQSSILVGLVDDINVDGVTFRVATMAVCPVPGHATLIVRTRRGGVACPGRSGPRTDPVLQTRRRPRSLRRPRFVTILGLLAASALFLIVAGVATTEPAAIESQRAELAQIQAEVDRINGEVSAAAERYNGAVYELNQVKDRITQNTRSLKVTKRDLDRMQKVLNERLLRLYTTREPSLAEVLVNSGSISEAADRIELLQRVGAHDANVVTNLHTTRDRLAELRNELIADRKTAAEQVETRAQEQARIQSLLAERKAVWDSANAELQQLIKAEQERQRREAERQAELARQRAAAERQQEQAAAAAQQQNATPAPTQESPAPESGGQETPAAATPAAALPSGSGNSSAANVAMQYLGTPYVWGGESPSGFDCSGLATYAYRQIGKSVPHYTVAAYNAFPKVPLGSLQAGDLVFFNGLNHMGIYIGGGQYVHAPQTGDVVKVSSLSGRSDIVGASRP